MGQRDYFTLRKTDRELRFTLDRLLASWPNVNVGFEWPGRDMAPAPYSQLSQNPIWLGLTEDDAQIVSRLRFHALGVRFDLTRNGTNGAKLLADKLTLSHEDDEASDVHRVAFLKSIQREFLPLSGPFDTAIEAEQEQAALAQHRIRTLDEMSRAFHANALAYQAKIDEALLAKKLEQEAELRKARELLQEDRARDATELQRQLSELELRKKELDAQDNTNARRGIRKGMLDDITSRMSKFDLSKDTNSKRRPVAVGLLGLILVFTVAVAYTVVQIENENGLLRSAIEVALRSKEMAGEVEEIRFERLLLWIRLSFFGASAIAAMVYLIRWSDNWARRHADAEFHLRQFQLDLNRASWLVETSLEWQRDGNAMPDALLNALNRNLFESQTTSETVLHPADELASALLGSASKLKLKLKTESGEVEFNKPSSIPKSKALTDGETS